MKEAIKTALNDLAAAGIGVRCDYEKRKVIECFKYWERYPADSTPARAETMSCVVSLRLTSPNRTVSPSQVKPIVDKFLTSL
jgi:hypothetical protein